MDLRLFNPVPHRNVPCVAQRNGTQMLFVSCNQFQLCLKYVGERSLRSRSCKCPKKQYSLRRPSTQFSPLMTVNWHMIVSLSSLRVPRIIFSGKCCHLEPKVLHFTSQTEFSWRTSELRHDSHVHFLFPQWGTPQRSLNNFPSLSCYAFRWSVVQPLRKQIWATQTALKSPKLSSGCPKSS